jgi:hypothetical protein
LDTDFWKAETDQAGLDHALRRAEIEFDRIAEAEVRALILRQRRERTQRELSKRKLVKAPMHPPSLNEVGGREQQSALSVAAAPKKDRKAVMKHLTDVAHKELQELKARLALETQRFITITILIIIIFEQYDIVTILLYSNNTIIITGPSTTRGCRRRQSRS